MAQLLEEGKVFEVYYALGVKRSIPKLLEELHRRYKNGKRGIPSEGTFKKWSVRFKWKKRIILRDQATYEGVAEKMTEELVDVKVKELEQIDKVHDEIDAVMPLIFDALQQCTEIDPKTGKKRVKIVPATTTEMAALYRAQAQFAAAKVKLIETARKIMGESDNVNLNTILTVKYEDPPDDE